MGDCEENTMFSILMKIYTLGQFYWYNLLLSVKKDRSPLFEQNLHIIALKRAKNDYELQGKDILVVKILNNGTKSFFFPESPTVSTIYF